MLQVRGGGGVNALFSKIDSIESILEFGSQDVFREDELGNITPFAPNKRTSAFEIYKKYGVKKYFCVDLDGGHNALAFDLGENLQQKYGFFDTFDFVSCREIGHHIWDQKTLWENIHNATNFGGFISWRSPLVYGNSAGAFAYMPHRALQLGICNNYILRFAHIYCEISGGEKKLWAHSNLQCFDNMQNTLDGVLDYLEKFRKIELPRGCDLYFRFGLLWQKFSKEQFIAPTFFYSDEETAIKRNPSGILLNFFPKEFLLKIQKDIEFKNAIFPKNTQKIAIFGTSRAAKLAEIFAKNAGLEVACFVDDFVSGENILSFTEFAKKKVAPLLLLGPYQKGYESRDRSAFGGYVVKLDGRFFSC